MAKVTDADREQARRAWMRIVAVATDRPDIDRIGIIADAIRCARADGRRGQQRQRQKQTTAVKDG